MKLLELIDNQHVTLDLEVGGDEGVLDVISEAPSKFLGMERARITKALAEREALGSTSVGDGFAIPHCKLDGLKTVSVWIARLAEDVEFGALDGIGVRFLAVVLSPPDQPAAHLQVLSQVARVLKRREVRERLMNAADADALIAEIGAASAQEGL